MSKHAQTNYCHAHLMFFVRFVSGPGIVVEIDESCFRHKPKVH